VDSADLESANVLCVLESVSQDTLGSFSRDELDALYDTINDNVLNTRVLSLGVLTDEDSVDVVVGGLEPNNRLTRTDIGEKVERSAESKVEGDVTFTNWCLYVVRWVSASLRARRTARGPLRAT
jgi:hypothetical protein